MIYTLYVKKSCPHSQSAIRTVNNLNTKNVIVDIDKYNVSITQVVRKLKDEGFIRKAINHTTVPIVFCEGRYIGGNAELQKRISRE